jgi:hypothetical protein
MFNTFVGAGASGAAPRYGCGSYQKMRLLAALAPQHCVESTVRMGFPPGITISGTRSPPEEYDSAGNNQLMEADSDRQDQNVRKILKAVTISGSASQILYTAKVNFKKILIQKRN